MRLNTTKGRELYKAITSLNLNVASTGEPTYWPTDRSKIPDVLDFGVYKGFAHSCLELSSDHSPVIINIRSQLTETERTPTLSNNKTNWSQFRSIVNDTISNDLQLKMETDIFEAVEHFNNCVQLSAWSSTPSIPIRTEAKTNPNILSMLACKRKLRKEWQKTRSADIKNRLNRLIKKLRHELQEEKETSVKRYLENLSPHKATDYSLWKATKKLSQPIKHIPPILTEDGQWAKTKKEKAEVFAKHLNSVFVPNPRETSTEEEQEKKKSVYLKLKL